MVRCLLVCAFTLSLSAAGFEQPRVEAGVLVGGLKEGIFGEYPVLAGGRVSVHTFWLLDAEAEVNRFPIGGAASNYPATQALFGARVGRRIGPFGVYGKLRPGFIRFDQNLYDPKLGTQPALDAGGILELYSARHIAGRFDVGDTMVWYSGAARHQLQWSVGLSLWF
jgi:hypothetical protein